MQHQHVLDVWRRYGGDGVLPPAVASQLSQHDTPTLEEAADLVVRLHGRLDAELWERKARMTGRFLRSLGPAAPTPERHLPAGFDPFAGDDAGVPDGRRRA
ncbi:MAG: hypothetical protein ACLGIR_08270 [Actinomycetes bacterium]